MQFERRCFAQIDLDAIMHNYNYIKKTVDDAKIMAVVKADAYGHGAVGVAKFLWENGADYFGVSGLKEALELRNSGIKADVLVFGYTDEKSSIKLAKYNIEQTVYNLQYAQNLNNAAKQNNVCLNVQIKVDTGMGRLGFLARDDVEKACDEIEAVCKLSNIKVKGIFTHFAAADSKQQADVLYTENQYDIFVQTLDELKKRRISIDLVHCCNSAAAFMYPQFKNKLVRTGIALYGESPSEDLNITQLKPAIKLMAVISQVKNINKGSFESYGRTFCAQKDMKIATVCAGYADGYPRAMSNIGVVSVNNMKAKVIGRVCMDQLMVDVSEIEDVKEGDIATLFGTGQCNSVLEVANISNTLNYEIICGVGRRVPRVYIKGGEEISFVDYLG